MKRTAYALLGALAVAAILLLAAAVPSQTDFDTTYFSTNALPMTLRGNLTNWSKLSTNAASAGIAGTVINAGASTANAIPRYTDNTGTNIAPTSVTISTTSVLFPDNTVDIGASGANRPKRIYTSSTINAGSDFNTGDGRFVVLIGSTAGSASTTMKAPGNGIMKLSNWTDSDFDRIQFGGTTASFPALRKHAANSIALVPADVSAGSMELQIGEDAASVSAQTVKAADGVGTDKNGAALTTAGGQGTGTGAGGDLIEKTSIPSTTGSTAQTYSTRSYTRAKPTSLTDATATTVANITLEAGKYITIHVRAGTFATDGTDHQTTSDELTISAVNKAGTITASSPSTSLTSTAPSSGTLTTAWTLVANGAASVDLKVNADTSLTPTTLQTLWKLVINSNDPATVTPQ